MFKIHDDKVYFVAETPDINKVIEIFLPKDDRGTIMDSHEIRVDLCRAVIHMEKKGVRVLKVRNIEDTNKASIDIWHMPEYQEAAESPVSDVVNACIESCFDSGAMFNLPCKANRKTHEVFAVECCASPDDDDSFSYAEVKINGKDYPINFIDDILLENNVDDALDEFYRIQQTGEYWQPDGNKTLDDAIHECRWAILKDAIQKRGHEAVADFVGTDISSDTYDRVMDETEPQLYGLLVSSSGRGIVRQRIFQGSGHKNSSRTYHHAAAYPPWFRDVESRYKGNREPLLPESLPS